MSVTVPTVPATHTAPPETAPKPAGAQPGSLLASLQSKRQEVVQRGPRRLRKIIPAWDGALSIVYRYPEAGADRIIKVIEAAQRSGKPSDLFDANCDVLIACWHSIEGRQSDGEWESLDPAAERVGIIKAGNLLQIDVPEKAKSPARFILRDLFSPRAATTGEFDGDLALMMQAGSVVSWVSGEETAADEALRGE